MTQEREYVVVVRAASSARFLPEQGQEITLQAVSGTSHPMRLRLRTNWKDEGYSAMVPRELLIEVRGFATSLDQAVSRFLDIARPFSTLLAFCANTYVGTLEVHLAFEAPEGASELEFLEVFVPDERGQVKEGRVVKVDEFSTLINALLRSKEQKRLGRALQQYDLALRYWYFGGEWLTMAHLYMAVEALTSAIIRLEREERSLDKTGLAKLANIDPDEPRWRPALETWIRANIIFQGDEATYHSAKSASDGLEHGFLDLQEVNRKAIEASVSTFQYVRSAILRLLRVGEYRDSQLARRPPRDVQSLRKLIRGRFIGVSDDLAPPGEEYPRLEWFSAIKDVTRQGDRFNLTFEEKLTVRCAPGVGFQGMAIEIRGRDEPGQPPLTSAMQGKPLAVTVTQGPPTPTDYTVMADSRTFATTIAANANETGIPPVFSPLFNLLSLEVAISESIEALLRANRPIQALPLLKGAILSSIRLEAFEDLDTVDSIGLAARIQLDFWARLKELYSSDVNISTKAGLKSKELIEFATKNSISIPAVERPSDESAFARDNCELLAFITEVEQWDEFAASLHSDNTEDWRHFRTEVISPQFVSAISGTATRALILSSIMVAETIGWEYNTVEANRIDELGRRLEEWASI